MYILLSIELICKPLMPPCLVGVDLEHNPSSMDKYRCASAVDAVALLC